MQPRVWPLLTLPPLLFHSDGSPACFGETRGHAARNCPRGSCPQPASKLPRPPRAPDRSGDAFQRPQKALDLNADSEPSGNRGAAGQHGPAKPALRLLSRPARPASHSLPAGPPQAPRGCGPGRPGAAAPRRWTPPSALTLLGRNRGHGQLSNRPPRFCPSSHHFISSEPRRQFHGGERRACYRRK